MTTVGIIGAGNIGSTIAKGLVERGYNVVIGNSRGPQTLAELVADLGPNARAATAAEAARAGEWAIVAVPLKAVSDLPVEPLADKIVFDTSNYYWERDGHFPALDDKQATVSQLVQQQLARSRVVKAFSHLPAADILTDGAPAGTPGRRALAIASDFPDAAALATSIYEEFGFDTVNIGGLEESWRVERDQPGYVVRQDADELTANLARATR